MSRLLIVAFDSQDSASLGGFAKALGLECDLLLVTGGEGLLEAAGKVMSLSLEEQPLAEALAPYLAGLASAYSHVAALSSMRAKDVLARAAGLAEAAMVTDVLAVESPTEFIQPMVAGSILARVQVSEPPVFMTVRPSGFEKVPAGAPRSAELVEGLAPAQSKVISRSGRSGQGRPDLSQASVVVSGGRPLGDAETFERVIGGLADRLGGAVGATRAAVDSGIAPNELQVGQTGKVVAPNLYIAAGISGSTQHMAGIKDSKIIVAINKDREAPIFESADFGLVADLFDAVPELTKKLPGA
jgi:electron transfer flavoprotein alpha subunit